MLAWPAQQSVAYEMTVALADDDGAQGLSTVQRFFFGSNPRSPEEEVKTTPITPITPDAVPAPATSTGSVPNGRPAPTLAAPSIGVVSESVAPNGNVTLTLLVSGSGRVRVAASLVQKVNARVKRTVRGKKTTKLKSTTKVTPLGSGALNVSATGAFKLRITPLPSALRLYRKNPKAYKVSVRLTSENGTAAPTVTSMFLSARSLALLAVPPKPKTAKKH